MSHAEGKPNLLPEYPSTSLSRQKQLQDAPEKEAQAVDLCYRCKERRYCGLPEPWLPLHSGLRLANQWMEVERRRQTKRLEWYLQPRMVIK